MIWWRLTALYQWRRWSARQWNSSSTHITDHLDRNNILTLRQHGFQRNYSCETQLVTTIDDWAKTIDKTQQTFVTTLDFSKAFDVVAHQRLLSKLSSCGIRGIVHTWVANFLMHRQQRVFVNGEASEWVPVSSGVRQGTSRTASLSDLHQQHNRRYFIRTPIICRRLFAVQSHQIHTWLRDSAAISWQASKVVRVMAYEV